MANYENPTEGQITTWEDIGKTIIDMTKEEFEKTYDTNVESSGFDPRKLEGVGGVVGLSLEELENWRKKMVSAYNDESKSIVVVDEEAYIVDKK